MSTGSNYQWPKAYNPGRYFDGNLRIKEREKRRMKGGQSSCAQGRVQDMVLSLRYRGSQAGKLDRFEPEDIRFIERLRSRKLDQLARMKSMDPGRDRGEVESDLGSENLADQSSFMQQEKPDGVEPSFRLAVALDGLVPSVETISMKRGGAAYQVPLPISHERGVSLSIRWLIQGTKERMTKEKHRCFADALRVEALYVVRDLSRADKSDQDLNESEWDRKSYSRSKKLTMHRIAKSNRVFAHLRWR